MRTPTELVLVPFLFNVGNNFVLGDDNWEVETCNSVCKAKLDTKLNRDIPEYCDSVEKRCTSCGPQCKYNRHMPVNPKCLCYCQTHQPGYGPYQLQFACSEPNLAVGPEVEQTVGVGAILAILAIVFSVAGLVAFLAIFLAMKRRRSIRADEEIVAASRDRLLAEPDQSNHDQAFQPDQNHAQPVDELYEGSSLVPSSMKNQFPPPVVAQEEHQDGTTAVKAVVDHRQSPINPLHRPQNVLSQHPSSYSDHPDKPDGQRERQIKDQEQDPTVRSEKVACYGLNTDKK